MLCSADFSSSKNFSSIFTGLPKQGIVVLRILSGLSYEKFTWLPSKNLLMKRSSKTKHNFLSVFRRQPAEFLFSKTICQMKAFQNKIHSTNSVKIRTTIPYSEVQLLDARNDIRNFDARHLSKQKPVEKYSMPEKIDVSLSLNFDLNWR